MILCYSRKTKVEPTCTLTDHFLSGPPKDHPLLASHPAEPHPTDQSSLEKQKSLNLNTDSYFINTLASPHANTWHHIGGPITQTIDHFYLNPNHHRSVEHTRKTLISCIEQGFKYTGRNVTKKYGRAYLLSPSSEITIVENSMQNRLGLRYTTLLINFHCRTCGDYSVSKATVNLAYRRLQPKITKIRKYNKERRMRVCGKRQGIYK